MRSSLLGLLLASMCVSGAQGQGAFQIHAVSVEPLKDAHKCAAIGGLAKRPLITIRHNKVAGIALTVHMFDNWEGGRTIDHGTMTIKSNASGTTIINANTPGSSALKPPCNRSDKFSNYYVDVAGPSGTKQVLWARLRTKS